MKIFLNFYEAISENKLFIFNITTEIKKRKENNAISFLVYVIAFKARNIFED